MIPKTHVLLSFSLSYDTSKIFKIYMIKIYCPVLQCTVRDSIYIIALFSLFVLWGAKDICPLVLQSVLWYLQDINQLSSCPTVCPMIPPRYKSIVLLSYSLSYDTSKIYKFSCPPMYMRDPIYIIALFSSCLSYEGPRIYKGRIESHEQTFIAKNCKVDRGD
jgi:hypothetical protein